jgi:DNA-directed RNA polymerase subunit RPC12/RpoP
MSDFKFTCPHCQQHLSADSSMVGSEVACPTCSGRLIVPEPPTSQPRVTHPRSEVGGTCPYCRAEITPTDRTRVCPACHTPHHADCWKENKGCTVFGCSMAPPDEEKISLAGAVSSAPRVVGTVQPPPIATGSPMFLYIPVSRLVVMSIVSLGLYEVYWIYRNWRYLKERDGLKIQPFWRGMFGVFYCHGILKAIRTDQQTNAIERASFSAGGLATGWIILVILGSAMGRSDEVAVSFLGTLISLPSFLFFLPVQNYINQVNEKINPRPPYKSWSAGHIVCLVWGIIIWLLLFAGMAAS